MGDASAEVALHVRAEHSEGPSWDAATARLWWVDISGERVHCFDAATGADCSWGVDGQPGGVLLDADGTPVVGMPDGLAVLDRHTGRTTTVVAVEADHPENRLNDMKADGAGRVWVGTMAYEKTEDHAACYRVADGVVTQMVAPMTISNGPGVDEPSGRLYVADTARMRVDVFDLDPREGRLSGRRPFLDVSDEQVWPDGMTVDDEGCLWVALGRSGQVRRYRPDGALEGVVELPVTNPTSVAFGGEDGGDLFITSSWTDISEDERAGQPLAGAIFRCRPAVTGPGSPRATPLA